MLDTSSRDKLGSHPQLQVVEDIKPASAYVCAYVCNGARPPHHGGVGRAGVHRGSQLVAWCAQAGAARVLHQVADAAALAWDPCEGSWQLLSPIFGVLLIRMHIHSLNCFPYIYNAETSLQ